MTLENGPQNTENTAVVTADTPEYKALQAKLLAAQKEQQVEQNKKDEPIHVSSDDDNDEVDAQAAAAKATQISKDAKDLADSLKSKQEKAVVTNASRLGTMVRNNSKTIGATVVTTGLFAVDSIASLTAQQATNSAIAASFAVSLPQAVAVVGAVLGAGAAAKAVYNKLPTAAEFKKSAKRNLDEFTGGVVDGYSEAKSMLTSFGHKIKSARLPTFRSTTPAAPVNADAANASTSTSTSTKRLS